MDMISTNRSLTVKTEDQLPSHILMEQLSTLYEAIDDMRKDNTNKYYQNNYIAYIRERDKILCWLMFVSAGRVSDVASMRYSYIDKKKGILSWQAQKNKKYIRIPLNQNEILTLDNYFLRWINGKYKEDYLFPTNRSNHISRSTCWKYVKAYGDHIDIKLHPHMFRHGMAIHMLRSGRTLFEIALFLGDRVETVAQHYLVVTDGIMREIRGNVDDISTPTDIF